MIPAPAPAAHLHLAGFGAGFGDETPALRWLALALLGVWALATFALYRGHWANDLAALWFAGHFLATGQESLVYAAPAYFFGGTPPEWEPLLAQFTAGTTDAAFPFIYPPLWAGLMAPVTRVMAPQIFFDTMLAVHLALMAGSVLLAERLVRPAWLPYPVFIGWGVAVLLFSTAAQANVVLNQPTVIATFLTLLAFVLAPRAPWRAGLVLALAAALKLTPLAFVLLFLIQRRFAAVAGFVLAGAALGLASLSFGAPLHAAFLAQLHLAGEHSIWAMMNPSPRILALFAADRLGLSGAGGWLSPARVIEIPAEKFFLIFMPGWVGRFAALSALAIAVPAGWLVATRRGRAAEALGLLGMSVALVLFGPLSWQHYLLGPLLLAPALLFGLPPRLALPALAAVFLAASHLLFRQFQGLENSLLALTLTVTFAWALVLALTLAALARLPRRA